jgi:hypothetical protein
MKPTVELNGLEIIVVGTLNPQIFHPEWFARQQLVQQTEADNATIEVVSPDVSSFSVGWARLQIVREYASFATNQSQHYELLRDLVTGTFKYLRFTPLLKFGINRSAHFKMKDNESWHTLGHALAPKEKWEKVLIKPGLLSLHVQGVRPDGYKGSVNVAVEPSVRIPGGVFMRVNDHFEIEEGGSESSCEKVVRMLNGEFEESLKRYTSISESILTYE